MFTLKGGPGGGGSSKPSGIAKVGQKYFVHPTLEVRNYLSYEGFIRYKVKQIRPLTTVGIVALIIHYFWLSKN